MTQHNYVSPVSIEERFLSLDILRGFAVLGILIMNIQSFAMIEAAYMNPMAFGDLTGINKWVWIFSHILGDQKFMTIFSILFGAGIILISDKAEKKGISAVALHYKRILWLFVFGMAHAYLLWHGDILVPYAMCATMVFLFRKLSPKALMIWGLLALSICSVLYFLTGWSMQFWPQESFIEVMKTWNPAPDFYNKEIAAFQGSWLAQMPHRAKSSLNFQTFIFFFWSSWRAGGLMLVGMALYKWGILTAQKSSKYYSLFTLVGILIGIPIVIIGVIKNFNANFALEYSMFFGWQYNYWGSLFVSFALITIIILLYQKTPHFPLLKSFSNIGRMAFSNYILTTIICTFIFYGHGLGLFVQVERINQIFIMIGVWIILIIFSNIWLKYFQFGPMEWLWRSLTYGKKQPFKTN